MSESRWQESVPNEFAEWPYLYAQCVESWKTPLVSECCYSSKGKVFFRTFGSRPSSISQSEFIIYKLILRGATVGGLRPPKVLKNMIWQCFPSELYEQVFSDSELWIWSTTRTKAEPGEGRRQPKLYAGKLRRDSTRGNRLKDKKTSGSSIDFHKPLTNVMDMDVILRGLRPASINRWTVLPYCSRWLGIRPLHHACTLAFLQTEGTFIICYCKYGNAKWK